MCASHERPEDELLTRSIRGEATSAEEARVRDWRSSSPENAAEYDDIMRIHRLSARLPALLVSTPAPAAEDVLARLDAGRSTVEGDVPQRRSRQGSGRVGHWMLAAAAVFVIALPAAWFIGRFVGGNELGFGAESFVTGPNEMATITLRDGSVVKLAPRSRLQLEPSRSERRVSLDGQGYFAVAPMNGQPFVVRTATGNIRVLGTRFDLSTRGDDLQLVVVEGRVAVSASGLDAEVGAGQVGRVVKGTPLPVLEVEDPHELTAWVGQFIAFQSTPLDDAAREIMRHYDVRIVIADTALAKRTITAWFSDWSLEDVMTVFCTVAEARCSTRGDVITVEPIRRNDAVR